MMVHDAGKLAIILVALIGMFALVLTDKAQLGDMAPYLTLVLGYVVGNGVSAITRRAPSPMIVPKVDGGEVVTVKGPATLERLTPDHTDAVDALDELRGPDGEGGTRG